MPRVVARRIEASHHAEEEQAGSPDQQLAVGLLEDFGADRREATRPELDGAQRAEGWIRHTVAEESKDRHVGVGDEAGTADDHDPSVHDLYRRLAA